MPLLKDGVLTPDSWTRWEGSEEAGSADLPAGPLLVTARQWQDLREGLRARRDPVGLWLDSDDDVDAFAPEDLERLSLIVLNFPKFTDGRSYSSARILRGRLGYRGPLRAAGNVLRDQLFFLQRCGFDEFALPEGAPAEDWLKAFGELSAVYQPSADRRATAWQARHAAGRSAGVTAAGGVGGAVRSAALPREAAARSALGNASWAY